MGKNSQKKMCLRSVNVHLTIQELGQQVKTSEQWLTKENINEWARDVWKL